MSYPGGKGGAGIAQRIINLMPPHRVYIEPFLGHGAVMRAKRPAPLTIGLDLDRAALRTVQDLLAKNDERRQQDPQDKNTRGCTAKNSDAGLHAFLQADALPFLRTYPYQGDELLYCDPPYMLSTCTRRYYRHILTDAQHAALLALLVSLPCAVMISHYAHPLYTETLKTWTALRYEAMTRGGHSKPEWLWCNFDPPTTLHDVRYVGENFRDRERIKRKKARWVKRILGMSPHEQQAVLEAINEALPRASLTLASGAGSKISD